MVRAGDSSSGPLEWEAEEGQCGSFSRSGSAELTDSDAGDCALCSPEQTRKYKKFGASVGNT